VARPRTNSSIPSHPIPTLIPKTGIGRALCEAFLAAGDDVVFCSRDPARVAAAEAELKARATARPGQVVAGFPCDVSAPGAASAFAAAAQAALPDRTIDVWINNAGATAFAPVMECDDAATAAVVATNLTGTLLASSAALRALAAQPGGGHLWNMDGAGSDGFATPNFAAYGATKAALAHLHKSLKAELKAAGLAGKVGLHRLSPGMVTTDLLMAGAGKTPTSNFFINVLAETPEDSAGFLVPRVRAVARSPPVSGPDAATVAFLTKPKALGQLAARLLTGARKGRWVEE
jgi:chlorophyll(ide) b reductase